MVQLHAKHGPPTEPLFPEGTEGPAEGPVSSLQLLNFRSCDQLTDAFCRLEKKPNLFCAIVRIPQMMSLYQDRLGTNTEKALKKRDAFCYSALGQFCTRLEELSVRENSLLKLKPFIYKNDHFTKTGSGQT
jgi:hypothetical protein